MIDNTSAYQTIGWIINHSDGGFFSVIASEPMQSRVVAFYQDSNIAVYDYRLQQEEYTFQALADWISDQPDKSAYFLLNFQRALYGEQVLTRLNFSRDMLWRLNKNIIFCMTKEADDQLCKNAYDFYSYIKLTAVFQDELVETSKQQPVPDETIRFWHEEECHGQLDIEPYGQWPEEKQLAYAILLSNRAEVSIQEWRYSDARCLLEAVLNIRTAVLGTEHPDTGTTYNNIANVYQVQGDYTKALEYYQKALDIRIKTLGTGHPETGTTYNNIAGVYQDQGDYTKALEYYQRALDISIKALGTEHPSTGTTYNNIAGIYQAQGDYTKALEYYQKDLAISEKALGIEHPSTGTTYNNIAGVYQEQGDYAQALEYYQKALDIFQSKLGPQHPNTVYVQNEVEKLRNHNLL